MVKKKLSFKIIFESSIIWGRPINKSVISLIKEYRKNKKISVDFYAPELVVEEAKKHLQDYYLAKRENYNAVNKDLNEIFVHRNRPNLRKRDKNIFEIIDKTFLSNRIKMLKTPVNDIDWESLIKRAVYKHPPFDPGMDEENKKKKEKGFKDAVIAETILVKLPKLLKDSFVILLCGDGLLSQYLREKTKRYKKFRIIPSIPDIGSLLRLHLLKIDDKLKEHIAKQAELAFYKPLEKNTLFSREEIQKKLFEKFPTLLVNPKIEDDLYYGARVWNNVKTLWVPIGGPTFEVSTPEFLEEKENVYLWESTIVYRQIFENQETVRDLLYVNFNNRGDYRVEFKVKWKSEITGDKILAEKCELVEIGDNPKVLSGGYDPMRYYNTPSSGATIAGQGTVQVVEPLGGTLATQGKWCLNCSQFINPVPDTGACPNCGSSL